MLSKNSNCCISDLYFFVKFDPKTPYEMINGLSYMITLLALDHSDQQEHYGLEGVT